MHPETDDSSFTFNMSIDGGDNYNVTKTTSFVQAWHNEADTDTVLQYSTGNDLTQSTSFQFLGYGIGNGNDESISGYLYLFDPSSTTFVKHFLATNNNYYSGDYSINPLVAGYGNTTSAVDAIQFKFSADEIQAGTISLYGIG